MNPLDSLDPHPNDVALAAELGKTVDELMLDRTGAMESLRRALVRRGYTCAAHLDGHALLEFACDMHDALKETAMRICR